MLTDKRHKYILSLLEESEIITLQSLVDELGVSESTIRRDFAALEEKGKLIRVHGGARRISNLQSEDSFLDKLDRFNQEKDEIANLAASFIEDNDFIYIDAGTTSLKLVPYLKAKYNLTVVTNGLAQAQALADIGIEPILLGGTLRPATRALVGPITNEQLSNYSFQKAFLGTNGIDSEKGLSTTNVDEAYTKSIAINNSNKAYILADESKFGKLSFHKFANISDVCILTTRISEKILKKYKEITRIEVFK